MLLAMESKARRAMSEAGGSPVASEAARNPYITRSPYSIGEAARASGVSAKMIRHYESIGLLPRPRRSAGNYRLYGESDVHTLRFIQRARSLGFSMKQIGELLSLWRNRSRKSASVHRLALEHVEALEQKAHRLQAMAETLRHLAHNCHGDERPECPILDDFSSPPPSPEEHL